jgi:flagellin-like hook-associated protein FlgL
MAMTINPVNDFAINQHNQAQTRSSQENSAARGKDKDSSSVPVSSRAATDSVELSTAAENLASAGSRLADFDQAQGTMTALKNTIRQQAGPALQAQANISSKTAFSLLEE